MLGAENAEIEEIVLQHYRQNEADADADTDTDDSEDSSETEFCLSNNNSSVLVIHNNLRADTI